MAYGIVTIDGIDYIERPQIFPDQLDVTVGNAITANQRVIMPGVAMFILKALTRESIAAGAIVQRRFRFRFGNTDGGIWYQYAGVGGVNDRVVDTLIFGSGQFPYPIVPHIPYATSANITYEVEDISNNVPYTIHFAFHGSYLIPA